MNVQKQFPPLGRDWMVMLNLDLISLMRQATTIHKMTADVVIETHWKLFCHIVETFLPTNL